MKLLDTCPDGISQEAFKADSNVRWDWKEQKAYEIMDHKIYQSRFEHFKQISMRGWTPIRCCMATAILCISSICLSGSS